MDKTFYIISAERPQYRDEVNAAYSAELKTKLWLKGTILKDVQGSYMGRPEKSFFVQTRRGTIEAELLELAKQYQQECILKVDDNGVAFFVYPGGHAEQVGRWQPIIAADRDNYDGYSQIGGVTFTIV